MQCPAVPPELLDDLRIGYEDVLEQWARTLSISRATLSDRIAADLAIRFDEGRIDYEEGDSLANALFRAWFTSTEVELMPSLSWDVYTAFDAGEYSPPGREDEDLVAAFTAPAIRRIAEGLRQTGA
jgi:hypothetical protein